MVDNREGHITQRSSKELLHGRIKQLREHRLGKPLQQAAEDTIPQVKLGGTNASADLHNFAQTFINRVAALQQKKIAESGQRTTKPNASILELNEYIEKDSRLINEARPEAVLDSENGEERERKQILSQLAHRMEAHKLQSIHSAVFQEANPDAPVVPIEERLQKEVEFLEGLRQAKNDIYSKNDLPDPMYTQLMKASALGILGWIPKDTGLAGGLHTEVWKAALATGDPFLHQVAQELQPPSEDYILSAVKHKVQTFRQKGEPMDSNTHDLIMSTVLESQGYITGEDIFTTEIEMFKTPDQFTAMLADVMNSAAEENPFVQKVVGELKRVRISETLTYEEQDRERKKPYILSLVERAEERADAGFISPYSTRGVVLGTLRELAYPDNPDFSDISETEAGINSPQWLAAKRDDPLIQQIDAAIRPTPEKIFTTIHRKKQEAQNPYAKGELYERDKEEIMIAALESQGYRVVLPLDLPDPNLKFQTSSDRWNVQTYKTLTRLWNEAVQVDNNPALQQIAERLRSSHTEVVEMLKKAIEDPKNYVENEEYERIMRAALDAEEYIPVLQTMQEQRFLSIQTLADIAINEDSNPFITGVRNIVLNYEEEKRGKISAQQNTTQNTGKQKVDEQRSSLKFWQKRKPLGEQKKQPQTSLTEAQQLLQELEIKLGNGELVTPKQRVDLDKRSLENLQTLITGLTNENGEPLSIEEAQNMSIVDLGKKVLALPDNSLAQLVAVQAALPISPDRRWKEYIRKEEANIAFELSKRVDAISLYAVNTMIGVPDELYIKDSGLHSLSGSWYHGIVFRLGDFLEEHPRPQQIGKFREKYNYYTQHTLTSETMRYIEERNNITFRLPQNFDDFVQQLQELGVYSRRFSFKDLQLRNQNIYDEDAPEAYYPVKIAVPVQ